MPRGRATDVAKRASSTFITTLGVVALAAVVAAAPVQAKKQQAGSADSGIADIDNGEPLFLVVSTGSQKLDIYRGTSLVTTSQVSTGMPAHPTFLGAFSILEKQRWHHSNIYSGAPMPWMNRITWSGTALHAGVVPGYPASHGCIRLPYSFAPKLYDITGVGDNVVISRDRPAPALIEHPALFQPLPPPPAPTMVKQEQTPQRQSSNDFEPIFAPATHPGMLAKADLTGPTTDVPSSLEAEAMGQGAVPALKPDDAAAVEDTHAHAFDPYAGLPTAAKAHGETTAHNGHALDDEDGVAGEAESVSAASLDETPAAAPAPATPPAAPVLAISTPAPVAAELPAPVAVSEPTPLSVEVEVKAAAIEPPAAAKVETPANATPLAAPAIAVTPIAPVEPVVAVATPAAPAPAAPPPTVQAVAAAPQANLAVASAQVDTTPSISAMKLGAGAKAAAVQAAEPRSTAPLRILVTRRTQRDRIIGVQRILADLGYLDHQDFDGTLGKASVTAFKAFQKANNMPETGAFTDELVKKVYEVAGKGEPPVGHMFVRQEFGRVFDAPVGLRNPDEPLGTHVYTALKFAPGDTKARWMAVTVQGGSPESALDRIEIPDDVRQRISERLTPGSTLIIGDTSINSSSLPKGGDFVVLAKYSTPKTASADSDDADQPKRKKVRRNTYNYNYGYNYSRQRVLRGGYPQWPW